MSFTDRIQAGAAYVTDASDSAQHSSLGSAIYGDASDGAGDGDSRGLAGVTESFPAVARQQPFPDPAYPASPGQHPLGHPAYPVNVDGAGQGSQLITPPPVVGSQSAGPEPSAAAAAAAVPMGLLQPEPAAQSRGSGGRQPAPKAQGANRMAQLQDEFFAL